LITGYEGVCPATPFPCVVRASVAPLPGAGSSAVKKLGSVTLTFTPGTAKAVRIKLSKRGAATLRKARRMWVKIKASIKGPDGRTVKRSRIVRISAP
jgi:hypothetical protein